MTTGVSLLLEGYLEEPVLARLLSEYCPKLELGSRYGRSGRSYVLENIQRYNQAARFAPWIALFDLEQDECAPEAIGRYLPAKSEFMCARIAVRSIEAWLIGDSQRLATLLGIPVQRVPMEPDLLAHPKRTLIELARRSRRRAVLRALVPPTGHTSREGPGYLGFMSEFVLDTESGWRPRVASLESPSLARAIARLTAFQATVIENLCTVGSG